MHPDIVADMARSGTAPRHILVCIAFSVSKPRRSGLWLGKTTIRTDSTVLERLAEYMMGNSGNLNSPNNIANALDANRVPTNHVTVGRYISYLRDAFVFYEAKRYDIKGKKCIATRRGLLAELP